ncbi:MAG TPA: hypothetical protein VF737_00765 [Gemmatimonadaceae bacterium]
MLASRSASRTRRPAAAATERRPRARRGFALGMALLFTLAIGALATSAIVLSSNATLIAKATDRQSELKYAAEAALQIGKSRLNYDPSALPDSGETQIISNQPVYAADGTTLPNVTVNVWIGPTGSTTGQFGRFASVVAEALDNRGSGFVRRLELDQESFAKFAYFTNSETCCGGLTIYFNNGDELWGPVYSNDIIHILNGGATFHSNVSTAKTISGISYGTFLQGYTQHATPITMPSTANLAKLTGYAGLAGYAFTPPTSGDETTVRQRIEFVATDITGEGDSLAIEDGFFRLYTAKSGQTAWLRGDASAKSTNCGDWHRVTPGGPLLFFPIAVHNSANTWFQTLLAAGGDLNASMDYKASATTVMNQAGARCYLGGDPHLVAVARTTSITDPATGLPYTAAAIQKGGSDTTFTPVDQYGSWSLYSNSPVAAVATARPQDAKYLFPLYRGYNSNVRGVVTFAGTIGVSGTLRGRETLYSKGGTIVLLDDQRDAYDPSLGTCADILGLLADNNIVVADNAINTPQQFTGGSTYKSFDDSQDMYVQAVIMALNTSFTVQNYGSGPSSALTCSGSHDGRGCLYVTGGLIQSNRGPVGVSTGQGYVKQYTYDRCAAVKPPPYFPTTGRFQDNRYFELDPVGFDVVKLFQSLTPGS